MLSNGRLLCGCCTCKHWLVKDLRKLKRDLLKKAGDKRFVRWFDSG
jgi:hypothetical protein